MTVTGHFGVDPEWCEEYGYGLGEPDGILVLKYGSAGLLEFGDARDDFVHQLYWSPDGLLSTLTGLNVQFVSAYEAFWAQRTVSHEVRAAAGQTVYRICLRRLPPALKDVRAGAVPMDDETARLIRTIATPGVEERDGLDARARIMAGLGAATREFDSRHARGPGFAVSVARALAHEPGDPTGLKEWALRLRTSVKTLQRDFDRQFGMSYSQWRTQVRMRAAKVLLEEHHGVVKVAHRVGYASPSAFIQAFTKEYGCTPGQYVRG